MNKEEQLAREQFAQLREAKALFQLMDVIDFLSKLEIDRPKIKGIVDTGMVKPTSIGGEVGKRYSAKDVRIIFVAATEMKTYKQQVLKKNPKARPQWGDLTRVIGDKVKLSEEPESEIFFNNKVGQHVIAAMAAFHGNLGEK